VEQRVPSNFPRRSVEHFPPILKAENAPPHPLSPPCLGGGVCADASPCDQGADRRGCHARCSVGPAQPQVSVHFRVPDRGSGPSTAAAGDKYNAKERGKRRAQTKASKMQRSWGVLTGIPAQGGTLSSTSAAPVHGLSPPPPLLASPDSSGPSGLLVCMPAWECAWASLTPRCNAGEACPRQGRSSL